MSEIVLTIDGKQVTAREGMTVLEAAQGAGIAIPTLCHHEKLAPFGACRLCIVESGPAESARLVAACVTPVETVKIVRTRSERVDRYRKSLLELMMAHAPQSTHLQELAREYGANADRFDKESDFCIHCGLCVRWCAEVKQKHAIGFIGRGTRKEISFIPDVAARECSACKECFPLCPTSYLQAVFVLVDSLAFHAAEPEPAPAEPEPAEPAPGDPHALPAPILMRSSGG